MSNDFTSQSISRIPVMKYEDTAQKFKNENEPPDCTPTPPMVPDPSFNPVPRLNDIIEKKKSIVNTITSEQGPSFVPEKVWLNKLAREVTKAANQRAPKKTTPMRQSRNSDDDYESDCSVCRDLKNNRSKKTKDNKNQKVTTGDKNTTRKRQRRYSDDDYESDCSVRRDYKNNRSKKTKYNKKQKLTTEDEVFEYFKKLETDKLSALDMIARPSFHKVPLQKKLKRKLDSEASSFTSFYSTDHEPMV